MCTVLKAGWLFVVLLGDHILWGHQLVKKHEPRVEKPSAAGRGCTLELWHFRRFRHLQHLCRHQPAVAIAAYEGLIEAVGECQRLMRFNEWNCKFARRHFTLLHEPPILRFGFRESAFLSALSSAGAAWGVATGCSQGWLDHCQCDGGQHSTEQSWEWGGCSYGVKFGLTTSRRLLTKKRIKVKRTTLLRSMEKHNLKAGRLAVKKTLVKWCKCHGVSGSCQQKTCWKKTSSLHRIGDHLLTKFPRARVLVRHNTGNNSSRLSETLIRGSDLVYVDDSPSFCTTQPKLGIGGVTGRQCSVRNMTHQRGDCRRLCCGRGHVSEHQVENYKCDCKFVWCCRVVCNECVRHNWVSTCR